MNALQTCLSATVNIKCLYTPWSYYSRLPLYIMTHTESHILDFYPHLKNSKLVFKGNFCVFDRNVERQLSIISSGWGLQIPLEIAWKTCGIVENFPNPVQNYSVKLQNLSFPAHCVKCQTLSFYMEVILEVNIPKYCSEEHYWFSFNFVLNLYYSSDSGLYFLKPVIWFSKRLCLQS